MATKAYDIYGAVLENNWTDADDSDQPFGQ